MNRFTHFKICPGCRAKSALSDARCGRCGHAFRTVFPAAALGRGAMGTMLPVRADAPAAGRIATLTNLYALNGAGHGRVLLTALTLALIVAVLLVGVGLPALPIRALPAAQSLVPPTP